MLAPAAIEAVKQWKYKPYILNGEPVEVETQITVNFYALGRLDLPGVAEFVRRRRSRCQCSMQVRQSDKF